MGRIQMDRRKLTIIISTIVCLTIAAIIAGGILITRASKPTSISYKEDGKYEIILNQNSAWKGEKQYGYVYELVLKNISDADLSDWSAELDFKDTIDVTQTWCGTFETSGSSISIKPMDYNKTIYKNNQVTAGFIVYSDKEIDLEKVTINGNSTVSSGTTTDEGWKDTGSGTGSTGSNDNANNDSSSQVTASPEATKAPAATETSKPSSATTAPASTKKPSSSTTVEKGTPVANHGKLSVKGTNIVDKNGDVYTLKGVSTHGIQWFGQYVNKDAFQTMRDDWGINMVRLAMYTDPNAGYTEDMHDLVDKGVEYATELGLYVIIDWHILSDGNPNTYKSNAIAYFNEVSAKYKDYDNVIYEICNEPNGDVTWARDIKPYAEDVVSTIRKNDKDAIIVVGSSTWSQDVHIVAEDPLTGYDNIMYSLHFYAATHKDDLRNRMVEAKKSGLAIFVTEFGICDASGNGSFDVESANAWMSTMEENNISFAIWNLSNKDESSALIKSSVSKTSGWTKDDLSGEGQWFLEIMGK